MEKRTVLAVVLSMLVIMGFYFFQAIYYAARDFDELESTPVTAPVQPAESTAPALTQETLVPAPVEQQQAESLSLTPAVEESLEGIQASISENDPGILAPIIIETNLIRVTLSNVGGDIISYQLMEHNDTFDADEQLEMIYAGTSQPHAFTVAFGSREDVISGRVKPLDSHFRVRRPSEYVVEFSRDFSLSANEVFTLIKRYEFKPDEYMFELTIALDGRNSVRSFDFQGASYTLSFGPQIGPRFEKLDMRSELRQYLTFNKNKVKQEKINTQPKAVPEWTAIVGKYFALIAIPNLNQFDVYFSDQREEGIPSASRMLITRPSTLNSRIEDRYYFYLGPKKPEILDTYYNGKNEFSLNNYELAKAAKTQTFFSIPPLENALKWILMLIHRIIPNYGVAIIILTILVKALLFPLTRKGSESTLRMQTLAPKIKEIQEKHKDNKQKMNMEMAELYKKEGYNPLAGCLPMLLQLPIFFAMYNLFNSHFDLRGAMFIPGWIPDLSQPESIFNFAPVTIPILGWSDLRLLPFIYVGSQILYAKVTQTPDQKGNTQMKLMLYVMPIVFFFVLYDVPSGLLLYWIMSNLLTMVQQIIINKYIAAKKAAAALNAPPEPPKVIAPPPKKRKKK